MSRTQELIERIDAKHEWVDDAVRGGTGTHLTIRSHCHICGMTRVYFSDMQMGIDGETTYHLNGRELSLREAADLTCRPNLLTRDAD